MTDRKQVIIPPGSSRLPVGTRSSLPVAPQLPSGNAVWGSERSRYERNAVTVGANTRWLEAKSAQYAAYAKLVARQEELVLALASYQDLPEKISHQRELGRLSRTAELRRVQLEYELAETNLKIDVAAANMRLAQTLPIPEAPAAPPPQPAPAPAGLTPADIRRAAERLPEMVQHPEAIDTLCMILSGLLAEKNR